MTSRFIREGCQAVKVDDCGKTACTSTIIQLVRMRVFATTILISWICYFDCIEALVIPLARVSTHGLLSTTNLLRPAIGPKRDLVCCTLTVEDLPSESKKSNSFLATKWSNFQYGADFVNSRYLALFWEYNFRRTMIPWVLPFLILLVATQAMSPSIGTLTFDLLKKICTIAFVFARTLGGILQLPFDFARWSIALAPALVVPILDYLPSKFAIQLVKVLLDLHSAVNSLAHSTFLTAIAVLLWRPMVEEIQYRYLLGNFLAKGRKKGTTNNVNGESRHMVHFIFIDSSNVAESQAQNTSESPTLPVEPSPRSFPSRRLLFSSLAFSLTRLGWLCSVPTTVDLRYPFLQAGTSTYSWTVAFIQSALAHFSSRMLSELSPFLQRGLLLLAIQQTVSTFLVTWHVFVPLYLERGILASIGGHVAWTLGKMTWPIRLIWREIRRIPLNENVVPVSVRTLLARKR